MKLNIGENIRRLRRDADLTQEQLAEKLGVSYQSVSRWENGTTYPDMEILPVLSGLFGVTVDDLLGCDTQRHDERLEKRINEYEKMCDSPDTTVDDILPLIRELRRECLAMGRTNEKRYDWAIFDYMNNANNTKLKKDPAVIEELRITAEEIFSRPTPQWLHDAVVYAMAHLEDEEHIHAFLERYATRQDLSADNLLFHRYLRSGEHDKFDPLRQKKMWGVLSDMVYAGLYRRPDHPTPVQECMQTNDMVLNFIHNLCGVTPDPKHPISGDGAVDALVRERILLGYRKSCYHAALGEFDMAWTVLEDTVSLLEKFMKLPEGTVVTCQSICLKSVAMKTEILRDDDGKKWVRMIDMAVLQHGTAIDQHGSLFPLTAPHGWEWFDSIRSDPRFDAYVQRVKVLFEPAPDNQ